MAWAVVFPLMLRCLLILAVATGLVAASPTSMAQPDAGVKVAGGSIKVVFSTPPEAAQRKLLLDWVATSARAVTLYYGQFPVPEVEVRINTFTGRGVRAGRATGWRGPHIVIAVGAANLARDFAVDWKPMIELNNWKLQLIKTGITGFYHEHLNARSRG
jgi:hypothetical protein